ncbi:hypothetical protein N9051_01525 [Akkermansiaceae bacterium]|nr:hypothetical protein [Akkermansiaceae bacterium]
MTQELSYPEEPHTLLLPEQIEVSIQRGITGETQLRGLGAGWYQEVLRNEHGSFYLAPPKGFFAKASPQSGYSVGGVYFPHADSKVAYLWELLLKNNDRSFSNPSTKRILSMDFDQPERALFLDPRWYQTKGFSIIGRPLIDTDFEVQRSLFQAIPPE